MASRVRRLFHRRKDDDTSPSLDNEPRSSGGQPALHTSQYDSTVAGGVPQTGDYPIKGNDSSVALMQTGRKSSVRSRRSSASGRGLFRRSTTPDQAAGRNSYGTTQSPPNDAVNSNTHPSNSQSSPVSGYGHNKQKRWSRTQLPEDLSKMNISDTGPSTVTQTVTTTHFSSNSHRPGSSPQNAKQPYVTNPTIRPVNQSSSQKTYQTAPTDQPPTSDSSYTTHDPLDHSHGYNSNSQHQSSIPRKQIGVTSTEPSGASSRTPIALHKRAGTTSATGSNYSSTQRPTEIGAQTAGYEHLQHPSKPGRTGADQRGLAGADDAQAVVDRANTNTKNTHITESVAPAVTQETVHRNIHHIREELITREVHEHDIYHRVLPVIDVEVLPPRHFLPVEGGGLVEIGANDVPGRGNHWVVAETASKIPSDQTVPAKARQFSARKFPGREGDARKYTTPEGNEKTEQTWVHPPELETGARDTGQSWPMVFGEDLLKKSSRGHTSPKASKKKNSQRNSGGHHDPPERVGSLGRTTY